MTLKLYSLKINFNVQCSVQNTFDSATDFEKKQHYRISLTEDQNARAFPKARLTVDFKFLSFYTLKLWYLKHPLCVLTLLIVLKLFLTGYNR